MKNWPAIFLFAVILSLCGCINDDANIYGGLNGQRIVGNETYVTITNVWNEMDALPLAEGHCAKYGKVARYVRMEGPKAIFDCLNK
jgi:hypothetical protein